MEVFAIDYYQSENEFEIKVTDNGCHPPWSLEIVCQYFKLNPVHSVIWNPDIMGRTMNDFLAHYFDVRKTSDYSTR